MKSIIKTKPFFDLCQMNFMSAMIVFSSKCVSTLLFSHLKLWWIELRWIENVYGIPFSMFSTLFLFLWHYHCHSICLVLFLCVFNIYLTHHSRFVLRRYLAFIFIGFGIFFTTNMKPINICLVYRRRANIKGIIFTFQSFTVVNLDVIFHFSFLLL